MSKPLTIGEKALIRADVQGSELYLWIDAPPIIFAAQINQTFATTDKVSEFIVTAPTTGAFADILTDMTVWIGSGAGKSDIGIARARKAASDPTIYIGVTSGIAFATGLYVSVLDEYLLWPKYITPVSDETILVDTDVAYSTDNPHTNFQPVPVMGSDVVTWLTAATVTVAFDASDSWVPGSTIASHAWTGGSFDDATSATPILTLSAVGRYRVHDLLTATTTGKTKTGHRLVRVFSAASMPVTNFELTGSPRGDQSSGGWEFSVKLYSEADIATVRDRARVILFAKDYYGSTLQSIGPETGRENTVVSGWIAGETIQSDPDSGAVTFTVRGPAWWLGQIPGDFINMKNTAAASASWTTMLNLTTDKMLHHLAAWRSTITTMMDLRVTGDSRLSPSYALAGEGLWSQLSRTAERIFARPACDRNGRMWVEIEPNAVPVASRTWTTYTDPVLLVTKDDWMDALVHERKTISDTAKVSLSGVVALGESYTTLYSLSAGHIPLSYGSDYQPMSQLLLTDQAQANALAGLIMGMENNTIEEINIKLASGLRMFDIAPRQNGHLHIAAADTPRNVAFDGNFIPRSITLNWTGNTFLTEITADGETTPALNVDGDIPIGDTFPSDPPFGKFKKPKLPTIPDVGLIIIPGGTIAEPPARVLVHDTTQGFLYTDNFNADPSTGIVWKQANWGLGAVDYLGIIPIYRQMTQMIWLSDGGVLVLAGGGSYPTTCGIWYASSPTSNYVQILDRQEAADLWDATPPADITTSPWSFTRLGAMGYGGGKILVNVNNSGGFGNGTLLMGDTGGTFAVTDNTRDYHIGKGISYGGGAWVETTGAGTKNLKALTPLGVESAEYTLADDYLHTRIGSGSSLYAWISFGGAGDVIYVQGNGATIGASVDPGAPVNNLATSASGSVTMAVVGAGVKKSTDYGSSWSAGITFPLSTINVARNVFCVDSLRWIVTGSSASAAYSPIVYSGDGGTTWASKYGNLGSLFPSTSFYFDQVKALP